MKEASDDTLIDHCRAVGEVIPVMGFYLQPAVGGRTLGYAFWRAFAQIEAVAAIKMAPFNRYQTIDVVRGVAESGREGEIALYTGNDDNIIVDLLTRYRFDVGGSPIELGIAGELLGHWAVWTKPAADQLTRCRAIKRAGARTNAPHVDGSASPSFSMRARLSISSCAPRSASIFDWP